MAKATEEVEALWARLRTDKVVIPDAFWEEWDKTIARDLNNILRHVESLNGEIPPNVGCLIIYQIEGLMASFRKIRSSSTDVLQGRGVELNGVARTLISHYLGNDLQKMCWTVEEHEAGAVQAVRGCVKDIFLFVERLRRETRG